jgi:non-specific serine/threonine protein kinase
VLRAIGGLSTSVGDAGRAARLFGAARGLRPDGGVSYPGVVRHLITERYEDDLAATQAALGEEAFARAWAEGRAMPLDEAVAYALEDLPQDGAAAPIGSRGATGSHPP